MHVELPPPHCSKCNSTNFERFVRHEYSGIRCLNCGHSKIDKPQITRKEAQTGAFKAPTKRGF